MPFLLTLPDEYGFVLLAAASTFVVNTTHVMLTSKYRKASGLKYPIPYASNELAEKDPKAFQFNCAQRAHANFTENHTSFLGAMLISGLHYPVMAAVLGAFWSLGRLAYAFKYSANGPQGRMGGSIVAGLSDLVLKGTALYTAAALALKW